MLYKNNYNVNIENNKELTIDYNSTENMKNNLHQTINNNYIEILGNENINKYNNNIRLVNGNNNEDIFNQKIDISNNINITIDSNQNRTISDISNIIINKNNKTDIIENNDKSIYNNNLKNITGNSDETFKGNFSESIIDNKNIEIHKSLNSNILQNIIYNLNTDKIITSNKIKIKTIIDNWRSLNISTNTLNNYNHNRYLIGAKYVKNSEIIQTTLAVKNIDNINNLKEEIHNLVSSDDINSIEIDNEWNLKPKDNKTQIYCTLNNTDFNLGQFGTNSTMPLYNLNNDINLDLNAGYNVINNINKQSLEINNFKLVPLDSHSPLLNSENYHIYGNGLNSANINIVYFSDIGNLVFHDLTPNIYTEHISENNNNNYTRENVVGNNYNIKTFENNIKTEINIENDDYINSKSYIFDINKNGILNGNININNLNKPGLYNEYHFNKSITTPFDHSFSADTNAQYNINNWLFPLNSSNNNNEGRTFSQNDYYFAFKLNYDKLNDVVNNIENCPKVFDIYGITTSKDFSITGINTNKSLLTPSIYSSKLINKTPNNLKLTQGIIDIDKSINNIDVSNYYLNKNIYKNTILDLSNIQDNIDTNFNLSNINGVSKGTGDEPKVVNDPLQFDNKVILINGKGFTYNNNTSLIQDKFFFLKLIYI